MPESVSGVDAILDGLRERATGWSCVPLADAVAAVHAAAGLGSPDERLREAGDDLKAAGDGLQSAASRMAEWVLEQDDPPYEVGMAAREARSFVDKWTSARVLANRLAAADREAPASDPHDSAPWAGQEAPDGER